MISVRFQGKPFYNTLILVYAPTRNAEEAKVEQFCHAFCLSTSIIKSLFALLFFPQNQSVWSDSTVLHILLFPSYLTLSLLCLTFALQSCLFIVFVNVTFISTALHLLMLFLIPEMLSIYRIPSSNLNLTNQCLLLCDNLY